MGIRGNYARHRWFLLRNCIFRVAHLQVIAIALRPPFNLINNSVV
jgi:hypothetical protein